MILATVKRDGGDIEEITISGHADAAEYGKDIVCSAVSAISFGMLNAVHALLGITPQVEQAEREGGFLRWRLERTADQAVHEKQQLLAESLIVSLYSVSQQYGTFLTVNDTKWQGGATT
ncbi:ribosomal-processing cysteine protease Prp [Brevibacillus sp. B_LB10_24]|uniref:ribosomal-processing cysteine protease Prp n=1 Tax=Brevibacillus sp. B_LB10_24 TaxID=3380645 RepID=UPI0038B94D4D